MFDWLYLDENVDKVEDFAENKLVRVRVVGAEGPEEVVDDGAPAILELLAVVVNQLNVKAVDQHAQLAT